MRPFVPDGAAFVARLEPAERAVLLSVVDDVLGLLGPPPGSTGPSADVLDGVRMSAGPVTPPSDPALLRLLPPASQDPEAAAELRRLTEQDLRATKRDHLRRLRAGLEAAGPELVVVTSEAPSVAAALTDVRLVVAERLGVRTDADSDAVYTRVAGGPDESREGHTAARRSDLLSAVHVVLGVLQESLVGLMLDLLDEPDPPDEPPDGHGGGPATDPALGSPP